MAHEKEQLLRRSEEKEQRIRKSDGADFRQQAQKCVLYGAGMVGMLSVYGLLQERIMTRSYGDEYFTYSVFLVLCNRVAAVLWVLCAATYSGEHVAPQAPAWKYLVVSVSNFLASTSQYECLKHVSFTVQMLAKSFKMIPVMMWGMAISQKRYEMTDWLIACLVTVGITEFMMCGPIQADHSHAGSSLKGILLLLVFLCFDGLTSAMQEKLFKEELTSKYNQMLYINGLSSIISVTALCAAGTLAPAAGFAARHPRFAWDVAVLSASAVGGQFFVVSQVREFGALVLAATMNLRQVLSILASYIVYKHSITFPQVSALGLVFLALLCKVCLHGAPASARRCLLWPDPAKVLDVPRFAARAEV